MDFHLKQWREQENESEAADQPQSRAAAKQPTQLLFDFSSSSSSSFNLEKQQQSSEQATVLPLFTPQHTTTKLSADISSTTTTTSSRMGGSCYFSMAQWQELELQALIFRHMLAGAAVPPQLLHLLKKSLILTSPSPYYMMPNPHDLQHYSPYQPALLQSGYWGRGAMDPEPGRCRRTDGKKWRCSRDVVGGHKYCERHMHRGRNRSRKPVENPTPSTTTTTATTTTTTTGTNSINGVGVVMKNNTDQPPIAAQPLTAINGGGGGETNIFGASGPSHSLDLLHFNQRPSESLTETKGLFRTRNHELSEDAKTGGGRTLRHFFDDWPTTVQEPENNASPGTSLSISVPGNPSSDFSLKLSTGGNVGEAGPDEGHSERERAHLNWGAPSGWGTNQMGGPLAEALRSLTSTSSPTSVLHQLRGDSSFITT